MIFIAYYIYLYTLTESVFASFLRVVSMETLLGGVGRRIAFVVEISTHSARRTQVRFTYSTFLTTFVQQSVYNYLTMSIISVFDLRSFYFRCKGIYVIITYTKR